MKVALIGGRRIRSGIGPYIGNYFHGNGAAVTAVLGTTEKTAREAASDLKRYGINATAHTDFGRMMEEEKPEAVAIASPASTHFEYLMKSIHAGAHVFCEKPFIWYDKDDLQDVLTRIFRAADDRGTIVVMNSQWPFALPFYEGLCGSLNGQTASSFSIRLSPRCGGKEMIVEAVPHALSILYCTCGRGDIVNLAITSRGDGMVIHFDYASGDSRCTVEITLTSQYRQPRDFSFGFNERIVKRSLDLTSYDIYFNHAGRACKIADPLELSVQDFMAAVRDRRAPLIGKSHIIHTTLLLRQIYKHSETI